jgi:ligand-binding SRPBCC domain-containing protein
MMPSICFVERYALPPAVVFAFFRRPANVVAVAPADLPLRLVEAPEAPAVGERFAVEVRRFGLSRRIETEVLTVEEPSRIVERQAQGPFREWVLERRFADCEGGTELTETIAYEPPGGMLGLMLTPAAVEAELRRAYEGRAGRVTAKIGPA